MVFFYYMHIGGGVTLKQLSDLRDLDVGSGHMAYNQLLNTYQTSFKFENFSGHTDGCTDGQTLIAAFEST